MAPLGENYRGNQGHIMCPLCQNHLDNQPTFLQCEVVKKETGINMHIEEIYRETISLETARNLTKVEEFREKWLKNG